MEMSEITAHRNNDKDVTKCLEQVDLQKRQPCSTANRMLQTLCENIVWNICEHYHGILKQNQTRSSGTAPVPVMAVVQHGDTNAAEVCHVRTLTNESITAQLLADAEASVADQARQYNEIMDLFKKKEDVQDPTSANEIIDWRGNYLEQHEVLAVTMEYNAKLQMALVSANGHIANLKKQLDKVEQSQQTLTYETMQEGKDKPSLFSTQWADRGILKGHERAIDRESQTDPVLPVKVRIADIHIKPKKTKLEKQLKEKEKRTAKTINDMKKKLTAKERERRILVDALERSNAEIAVIKKQSTVADSEISGLKSALANVERKGQLMNESTSPESTKKINLLEEQVAKLQNMLKTERDNKQFRETISKPLETGVRVEELKKELDAKKSKIDDLKNVIDEKTVEITRINGQYGIARHDIDVLKLALQEKEEQLAPASERIRDLEKSIKAVEAKNQHLQEEIKLAQERLKERIATCYKQKTEFDALQNRFSDLTKSTKKQKTPADELNRLQAQCEALSNELSSTQRDFQEKACEVVTLRDENAQLHNQLVVQREKMMNLFVHKKLPDCGNLFAKSSSRAREVRDSRSPGSDIQGNLHPEPAREQDGNTRAGAAPVRRQIPSTRDIARPYPLHAFPRVENDATTSFPRRGGMEYDDPDTHAYHSNFRDDRP